MLSIKLKTIIIFVTLLLSLPLTAGANGYLIIESVPGIEIYLDDEFIGITAENDMLIEKPAGNYQLLAKKDGYYEKNLSVEVESLDSNIIKLEMEIADIIIRGLDSAELDVLGIKTGSVEVKSLPYTGADIFMQGQFVGSSNFKFDHVLTGDITMKVLINGEIIEETFNLKENEERIFMAHFGLDSPALIELFDLNFAGILPTNYYIEIQGEYRNVIANEIGKAITLLGPEHTIRINDGSKFLNYNRDVNLADLNFIDDLPLPDHYLNMVYVEAGKTSFENGWVEVENDFYINKYSVTQSEFEDVMGFNPSHYINNSNNPVETVTWYDAVLFCNRLSEREGLEPYYNISYLEYFHEEATLGGHPNNIKTARVTENPQANGYRLPTREEHEYAARGGYDGLPTTYAGSDDLNEVGWYWSNSGDTWLEIYTDYGQILNNNNQTKPVGQKQPNELGLYDMSGNVWNYTNTFNGDFIYKRGGSYQCYSEVYSIGAVGYDKLTNLSDRYRYNGFRVVRSHN